MAPIPQRRVRALRPGAVQIMVGKGPALLLAPLPLSHPNSAPALRGVTPTSPLGSPAGGRGGHPSAVPTRLSPPRGARSQKGSWRCVLRTQQTPGLYTDPLRHPPPPKQLRAFQDLLPAEQTPQVCPAHSHEAPTPPPPPSIPRGCSRGHRGTLGELKPPCGVPLAAPFGWEHPPCHACEPGTRTVMPRCCDTAAPCPRPALPTGTRHPPRTMWGCRLFLGSRGGGEQPG